MDAAQQTLPGLPLRAALRDLRAKIGRQLTALARGLHEVASLEHFRAWGYDSLPAYARAELDLEPGQTMKLVQLYEAFKGHWSEAKEVPASRLLPTLTLIRGGRLTAEDALARAREMPTADVRAWVRAELRPPALPGVPTPGSLTWADPLPAPAGVELLQRSGRPGTADDVVVLKLALPVPVYRALVAALLRTRGDLAEQFTSLLTP